MEKKKASLTWQLVFTMIGIVAGTVILCWFFNSTFLEKYYIYHKEKDLRNGFKQIGQIWTEPETENADVILEKICADGNINMLITNRKRELVWSSYSSAQRLQMQMEDWLYGSDRSTVEILYAGEQYTLVRQKDERLQSEYLVLLGNLENGGSV